MLNTPVSKRTVIIDVFPEAVAEYRNTHAIVSVDVIRATTVAVTAAALGRRCLIARDVDDAFTLRDDLQDALLAGELAGDMPPGFEMNNSPADLVRRQDIHRPMVMLSSSGTKLMLEASRSRHGALAACFRNAAATAEYLIAQHPRVAVIGAGSRNEFREEDQICCAWIAGALMDAGFHPETEQTIDVVRQWQNAPAIACEEGNSVRYLRRSGQMRDFDFVIKHVNDVQTPVLISDNEIATMAAAQAA